MAEEPDYGLVRRDCIPGTLNRRGELSSKYERAGRGRQEAREALCELDLLRLVRQVEEHRGVDCRDVALQWGETR